MNRDLIIGILKKTCVFLCLFIILSLLGKGVFAEEVDYDNGEKYAGQTTVRAYVSEGSLPDTVPDDETINDGGANDETKTGDDNNLDLWFSIAVCALAAIWIVILKRN